MSSQSLLLYVQVELNSYLNAYSQTRDKAIYNATNCKISKI